MAALRRSLFVVAPSVWPEPFGLMALEAAATGTPVIASDIGGLSDIVVDEETGLLVEPGNRSALRAAMERLITDAELRSALAANASRHAESFSADAIVPRFEEAYELARESRRARRG
jgi:glycosyltransferase involved in cell wall biosynthesis